MVALPKKKIPRRRRNNRRSHLHAHVPQLGRCPQCHQLKPTHQVCHVCGTYNGHVVIDVKHTIKPL
jgi:large subunit ribosomal protein L32